MVAHVPSKQAATKLGPRNQQHSTALQEFVGTGREPSSTLRELRQGDTKATAPRTWDPDAKW